MNKISVIIPCFNEEDNIQECIRRINLECPYEIVVVDDGSKDKTIERAKRFKKKNLKVIGYKNNWGKGYAVNFGIKNSSGKIIVIQDADMSTPPEELPKIIQPILRGDADFVNGTRFIYRMEEEAMKRINVLGNKMFAKLVSFVLGIRLTDTLCGFKAFNINKFSDMNFKENSWPDFELLFKAKMDGLKIIEIPIHYKKRVKGRSKMKSIKHGFSLSKILLKNILEFYF